MAHYFTCEHCGKTFENSKNAYRNPRFCSRECWWNSQRITNTCENCGKTFKTTKSKTRKYCSKECRLDACWGTPADPTKRSIFICDWCGKEFEEWTYRQPRFCSNQCRSEFAARQPKPGAYKPEIHITLVCKFCGKKYQTTTHQKRLRGSRFCSTECRDAMMSIERCKEGNPNWNGGAVEPDAYGSNWGRQSRRARKRDNHTCQICGYRSGGDRALDVHHIKKLREFNGNWKAANRLSNLICLCRSCHLKVDHGTIDCPNVKR